MTVVKTSGPVKSQPLAPVMVFTADFVLLSFPVEKVDPVTQG